MSIEAIKAQLDIGIAENETDMEELQAGAVVLSGAVPSSGQVGEAIGQTAVLHGNANAELVDISTSIGRSIEHLKEAQAATATIPANQHNAVAWSQQAEASAEELVDKASSLMGQMWGPEDALATRMSRAAEAAGKATAVYAQVVEGEPVVKQAAGHSRDIEQIQETVVQLAGEVEKAQAGAEWMRDESRAAAQAVGSLEAEAAQIIRNIAEVRTMAEQFMARVMQRHQAAEAVCKQLQAMQKEQAGITARLQSVVREIGSARVSGLQTIDMAQTKRNSL